MELKLEREPDLQLINIPGLKQSLAHVGCDTSLPQDFADLVFQDVFP